MSSSGTSISRAPQNGGVGIGTSVRAAERTLSSSVTSAAGSLPCLRKCSAASRVSCSSASRCSGTISRSILCRPSKASLQ